MVECKKGSEKAIFEEKSETLHQFPCSNCNQKGGVDQNLSISKFPDKLIVLIKRFDNKNRKNSTVIDNFLMGSDRYRLKTIISHLGKSTKRGHYKTFQFLDEKTMIEYDDKYVSIKPLKNVEAYILGFEKIA